MTAATMFYAYPSRPSDLTETIEAAIHEVNQGGVLSVASWTDSATTGKVVIDAITRSIDEKSLFACDLTYLNPNVLFELGFAIGRAKRVWISLNDTVEDATRQYRRLESLVPIGYAAYANRVALVSKLYADRPWDDANVPTIPLDRGSPVGRRQRTLLLYLRSLVETDASIALMQELQDAKPFQDLVVDDPKEVAWQTLDWYVQAIQRTTAVVIHLLSDGHKDANWHNAKCSFVAGIAHGCSKPIIMLAHAPFSCPLDYRTLLQVHANARDCRTKARRWLDSIQGEIAQQAERVTEFQRARRAATDLQRLSVGETVAENEDDDIDDYFVETNPYLQALQGHQTIFVGRKGSGKTANLYAIAAELRENRANLVCLIKPVAYEVEGVLRMLRQSVERSERGFLVESFWKFLVYTEITNCLTEDMRKRPPYQVPTDSETRLRAFVDQNSAIIEPPFSVRLQNAVDSLVGLESFQSGSEQRAKVSELLHDRLLARLRQHLREVLSDRARVAILVDNLDKAWERGRDIDLLSELIFGLLGVTGRIRDEFQADSPRRDKVNLTLAVFLRSDIFSYIQDLARERDKLTYERLSWSDPELLIRVLDERFVFFMGGSLTPDQIWERYFVSHVDGVPIKRFIVESVIHRPRDVIYLVKAAIGVAVNRGHARVEEEDLRTAILTYSQYVLDSLIVEDDPRLGWLENVLYEFAGSPGELSRSDVVACIERAAVSKEHVDRYFEMLIDLNFLGIVMPDGTATFPVDDRQRKVSEKVASKVADLRGLPERYLVNAPFRPVLQIG